MEKVTKILETLAEGEFVELNKELEEYLEMQQNLNSKLKNKLYISSKRFLTTISFEKKKLTDTEYILTFL